MAATKRNAGLTSVLPRATLNDEELVTAYASIRFLLVIVLRNIWPRSKLHWTQIILMIGL